MRNLRRGRSGIQDPYFLKARRELKPDVAWAWGKATKSPATLYPDAPRPGLEEASGYGLHGSIRPFADPKRTVPFSCGIVRDCEDETATFGRRMLPFPLWRASEEADCRIRSRASPWKYRAASSMMKSSLPHDLDAMPRRRPSDSMSSLPLAAIDLRRIGRIAVRSRASVAEAFGNREKGNGDAGRRWRRRSRIGRLREEEAAESCRALRLGRKRRRRRGGGRRRRQGRASSGRRAARFRRGPTCRRRLRGRSARSSIRGCPDRSTRGS